MQTIIIIFFVLTLIVPPLLAWGVGRVLSLLCGLFSPTAAYWTEMAGRTMAVGILLAIIAGHFIGPRLLAVKEVEYRSELVPRGFDGYRIALFSDMHLASQQYQPKMVKRLVDTLLEQKADMICFAGDLVTIDRSEMSPYTAQLSRLTAPDGVYSVLGNHDYHMYSNLPQEEQRRRIEQMKSMERGMGWDLLLNESRTITRGQDTLCLGGVENDGDGRHFPQLGDLNATFNGKGQCFKVLISHDPTHWRRAVLDETDVALTMSGHTHGMQFKVFGWSPSKYLYPEWCGMYNQGNRSLYVTTGVGGAGLPFRLGAWPEIVVITLRHQD